MARVRDEEPLDGSVLHGFGGIVDQIDDDALELLAIDVDGRQAGSEVLVDDDAVEAACEDGEAVFDDALRSAETGWAAGKRVNWENSSTRVFTDWTSREMVVEHSRRMRWGFGGRLAIELAGDAVGAERDGREGILDLVGNAPGHFVPGSGLSGRGGARWCLR